MPSRNQPVRPVPSHSTDRGRITARRSSPDWFKNFVEPQLETFQQQPLVRMYQGATDFLGDPTDPANLAVGFMSPARRLAQANKLAKELEISQNIYKGYGAEHRGIKSLQNAVEKYPHLMGHFADVGMLPETSMPKAGQGVAAGYFQRLKGKTTKALNATRETSDPNYRMKLSQEYGIAGKWGRIAQDRIDRGITRHELGHAATALKDEPSALNYKANSAKYGYRANPDEIRANAIAAKHLPRPLKKDWPKSIYTESYPKNDYMRRLENEVWEALAHPETKDVYKRQFARDFMNYEVDLPPQFYNYFYSQPGNREKVKSFVNFGRSPGVTSARIK